MADKKSIIQVIIDATKAKEGAKIASSAYIRAKDDILKANQKIQSDFDKLNKFASSSFIKTTKTISSSFASLSSAIKAVSSSIRLLTRAFSSLASVGGKAIGFLAGRIRHQLVRAIDGVLGKFTHLIALLGPVGVFGAVNAVVNAGLKLQKLTVTLSVITGSMGAAKNELQGLLDVSNRLGVSITAAATPFAKFFAAAKDSISGADIRDIFTAFSEVSVALSLNSQEVTGVFLALQQIASKGKVSMEELRLQLAERVPGAMAIAARSMRMSMRDFEDAVRAGTINASEFLVNFGKALHEVFGDAAVRAADLAQAGINRFLNTWWTFTASIADAGVLNSIIQLLDTISDKFLKNEKIVNVIAKVMNSIVTSVTRWVEKITHDGLEQSIISIANGFISIYNTVISVIPEFNTLAAGIRGLAKLGNMFVPDTPQIKAAKDELKSVGDEIDRLVDLRDDSQGDLDHWEHYTKLIDAAVSRMTDLENIIKGVSVATSNLQPIDMISALPSAPVAPTVGDATAITPNFSEGIKNDAVNAMVDSALLTEQLVVSIDTLSEKYQLMQDKMIEAQSIYEEAIVNASSFDADVPVEARLQQAEKLQVLLQAYTESKLEFDKVNAQFMNQQNQEFQAVAAQSNSIISSLGNLTSAGRDLLDETLTGRQMAIETAFQNELLSYTDRNELVEAIQVQHQARLGDIHAQGVMERMRFEQMSTTQQIGFLASQIQGLTAQSAQHSRKMFELNKAAGMANTIVSTVVGATKALELGPILGPIMAGVVWTAGAANLAILSNTKFGSTSLGGGGTSSGGGAVAVPTPTIPAFDNTFNASQNNTNGQTFDSSGMPTGDQININFEINALDGPGVRTVLAGQEANITGMVQRAYDKRGANGGPLR